MVSLHILLSFYDDIGLPFPEYLSDVFAIIIGVKGGELDPSREVPRSHLDPTPEIVSVVLRPADHRQHKVGLSQISALETL
jgi:hypothetical protein